LLSWASIQSALSVLDDAAKIHDNRDQRKESASMSPHDLVRSRDLSTTIPNSDEILTRYLKLRATGRNIGSKLVKRLSKEVLHEGGKKLGMLSRGVFVFNTEDESSVLMDYCIYDVRQNGRNAVEEYLIDSPPDPDSQEMVCLRAMQHAIYSIFVVETVHRGVGVTVRDLPSDRTSLVVDTGLGSTASPKLLVASRLLFHDDFAMTGGAALPFGMLPEDRRPAAVAELSRLLAPAKDGTVDPAPMIRTCLSRGASDHIGYQEPTGEAIGRGPADETRLGSKVGRNDPCPCGSGKKFKHCCLKK
jgi:SEC-C motif